MDTVNVEKPHFTHDLYYWPVHSLDVHNVFTKAEVLDCHVTLKDNDPYGAVTGSEITLRTFCIAWPRNKLGPWVMIWSLPPLVNQHGLGILPQNTFVKPEQIICSFDELPKDESSYYDPEFYVGISLAHILRARARRQFALLLKPAKEEGKFVKIGVAELPPTLDENDLVIGGWEKKNVTIA